MQKPKFEIENVLVYNTDGNFLLNASFSRNQIDTKVIGGLVIAINEFTGKPSKRTIRSIVMKEFTIKFSTELDVLFVFISKKGIAENELLNDFVNSLLDAYSVSFLTEDNENMEWNDKVAIAFVKIILLLSEEYQPSIHLGDKLTLDLELLFYEADKSLSKVLSSIYIETGPTIEEKTEEDADSSIEKEEQETQEEILEKSTIALEKEAETIEEKTYSSTDSTAFEQIQTNPIKTIEFMVRKFNQSFSDIVLTTIVLTSSDNQIQTISEGTLANHILEKLNSTVLELLPIVYSLWDKSSQERTLELGEYWAFFQKINESSFMYVITKTQDSITLIEPILERLAYSIQSIVPTL